MTFADKAKSLRDGGSYDLRLETARPTAIPEIHTELRDWVIDGAKKRAIDCKNRKLRHFQKHCSWNGNPSLRSGQKLRIDLHHIERLAHYVELGDAGSKSICGGIEDIDFRALDDVDHVAAGNRLQARYVKVLAEG